MRRLLLPTVGNLGRQRLLSNAARVRRGATARLLLDLVVRSAAVSAALTIALAALYYPRASDAPLDDAAKARAAGYYAAAYEPEGGTDEASGEDPQYVRIAEQAAENARVHEAIDAFVSEFGLRRRAVLDVGAGRGYLQDAVENYTGLDISASAAR